MIKKLLHCLVVTGLALALSSCAGTPHKEEKKLIFNKKPSREPGKSPTPQMIFFEDAEKAADVNDVIVIPPDPAKKKDKPTE